MLDPVATLIARLLAQRWLPREDELARRALLDEPFRSDLDARLAACGMVLREHPYAANIGLALARAQEKQVFAHDQGWLSNQLQLDRNAIALLVVLWSLIVLPKRQRQVERQDSDGAAAQQGQMFADEKPIPVHSGVAPVVSERTLLADFGERLGGKMGLNMNLGVLARHGFIQRRTGEISEGPLLDLAFDYERTSRRVLDGALSDLLSPAARAERAIRAAETGIEPAQTAGSEINAVAVAEPDADKAATDQSDANQSDAPGSDAHGFDTYGIDTYQPDVAGAEDDGFETSAPDQETH